MELQTLKRKIFEIRNQKVMLDIDLSDLYETETRSLKQAVNRNIDRFPEDFMFQLTKKEWNEVITDCDNLSPTAKFSPYRPMLLRNKELQCFQVSLKARKLLK